MKDKPITVPAVRPSAGIARNFQAHIDRLIREMHADVRVTLLPDYDAASFAQDENPVESLISTMRHLRRKWLERFDVLAPTLGRYFAQAIADRSDRQLKNALRRGGFSVRFQTTQAQRDMMEAMVHENVSLIKSIASEHLSGVEGLVMRSVQAGRDLASLSKGLQERYGATRRRAAFIARQQNNAATGRLQAVRQKELGLRAEWLHSAGDKVPRPTHKANSGNDYDPAIGWFDPAEGRHILPGELINCLPENSPIEFADGVEIAYRHWFAGDLTTLITEDGKAFRSTPNHPVLTTRGWIGVGRLQKGDYLIKIADEVIETMIDKNDIHNPIASIGEIFNTMRDASISPMGTEIGLGANFHGDVTDHDIDIVRAARPLLIGSEITETLRYLKFTVSDNPRSRISSFFEFSIRCLSPARRSISLLSEAFTTIWAYALHSNETCIAQTARMSASRNYPPRNRPPINPIFSAQGEYAFPSLMFPTQKARIQEIQTSPFSGHVYNLQTKNSWYMSGGVIAHNCTCVSKTIVFPARFKQAT